MKSKNAKTEKSGITSSGGTLRASHQLPFSKRIESGQTEG